MAKPMKGRKADRALTVITTHVNADFDALASMLAAQKLYPGSMVVFPGSQEKNLRNFFIKSMVYLLNMVDIRDIDFDRIQRLVLVDTKQPGRIGKMAELLKRKDLEIHIFDHHPATPVDVTGSVEIHRSTGANVTILIDEIRKHDLPVSPDEATIMCLGIYEDTGSFMYPSTSEEDFRAAAFLLSCGANLNIVSNLVSREINPDQVALLNDMIQSAVPYNIDGIEVVVTTVTTDDYVNDFALLVQKMVKMEKLDAIFACARMGNKIYLVARSRVPEVDAGEILSEFGGGGHGYAAAASIKGQTLAQTENRLVKTLYAKIQPRQTARNLMTSPAITVAPEVSCRTANDLLTRYNINALLVIPSGSERVPPGPLLGYITRQIIEKALYHRLDEVAVREYMNTEIATVAPQADLLEIQEKIFEHKQRILPVVDGGEVVGVITRTDLLRVLVKKSPGKASDRPNAIPDSAPGRKRHILKFMKERLSPNLLKLLRELGAVGDDTGCNVYVVGGFVRDLILYRTNEDMDIVIEGDGIAFARKFAKLMGGRIHAHEKFGTAVIVLPDGFKIDVASARLEYYKFPAALPIVEMSSIKLDLFRRDFTINTLAIFLNPDRFGVLIDFFTAQRDIKERVIRVLHNLSFVEDPTRVFRAIRFEQRFGFSIGKLTAGLIENAVKMDFFRRLSGRRVFSELKLILDEENPLSAVQRMQEYDLLKTIHPEIRYDKRLHQTFTSVKKVVAWHDLLFLEESYMKWFVYFLVLFRFCDERTAAEVIARFEPAPRIKTMFCTERFRADKCLRWLSRNIPVTNSALYHRLSGFRTELILYMMAVTRIEDVKRAISHYFTQLRDVSITIDGEDLKRLGLAPGPLFRRLLTSVLDAKLNGWVKTRQDELAFVRKHLPPTHTSLHRR